MNIPGLPRERRADFDRELRPRLIKGGIASVAWIVLVIIFSGFTTSLIISTAILLALYAVPWNMLRYGKWVVPTVAILLAITYPYYRDDLYEVPLFGPFPSVDTAVTMTIFIMMAIGLNIVVGYAGLLDLGYVAFYAMGAYTAAWFASPHFGESVGNVHVGSVGVNPEAAGFHVSIWVVLIVAGIFTGIIGVLIGLPTLRLRGDYLAIVTLGFGEIMPQIARNGDNLFGTGFNLTNGAQGINPIDPPGFGAAIAGWTGLPEDYLSFNANVPREGDRRRRGLLLDRARAPPLHRVLLRAASRLAPRPRVDRDPRGRDRRGRDGRAADADEDLGLRGRVRSSAGSPAPTTRASRAGRSPTTSSSTSRCSSSAWSSSAGWATSGA